MKPIKFKANQVWEIYVVRAIDIEGHFQLGLVIVSTQWRRYFSLDAVGDREDAILEIVETLYEQTAWYSVPEEIHVEEKGLAERLSRSGILYEAEVDLGIDRRRKRRAEQLWRAHCRQLKQLRSERVVGRKRAS